jgi:hypothetical protein
MYSDYNIIPIGDHCVTALILKEIEVRKKSYPFDWVTLTEQVHDTNIMYNLELLNQLKTSDVNDIVKNFIGNAFENNDKINNSTNIWFPHDDLHDSFEKYKRRFNRLKEDLNQKNIFILVTRHYYIEKDIFQKITEQLLSYNNENIILFISGTDHPYIENKRVIFKYIHYDISQFYGYDYTTFRPAIKEFLHTLFI